MTDIIREVVEKHVEQMFIDLAEEYELKSGDIGPAQAFDLSDIKESLGELLGDYVHQNMPEGENGEEI